MTTCQHFTGIQNKSCKAGVVYEELFGSGPGWAARLPCTSDDDVPIRCDKQSLMTREQAEAEVSKDEAKMKVLLNAVCLAHEHAHEKGLGVGSGGQGEMPCPKECGGTLRYRVASYNGHMHAACSTKDCLSWME